jgi:hypothetical protein
MVDIKSCSDVLDELRERIPPRSAIKVCTRQIVLMKEILKAPGGGKKAPLPGGKSATA